MVSIDALQKELVWATVHINGFELLVIHIILFTLVTPVRN